MHVRSKQWIENQRLSQKGVSRNVGKDNPFYGRQHTLDQKKRWSKQRKGKKRPPFPKEWRENISKGKKGKTKGKNNHFFGKHHSEKTKQLISQKQIKNPKFKRWGKDHWNWQGGKTPIVRRLRCIAESKEWRTAVFKRDNFTCQICGIKGARKHPLNAHHIKSFAKYPQLRFKISNGITFCKDCHKSLRKIKLSPFLKNKLLIATS